MSRLESSSSSILFVLAINISYKYFTKSNKLEILHEKKRVAFLRFLKNIFILQMKKLITKTLSQVDEYRIS